MRAQLIARKAKVFRPRGVEADGLKYYQEQNKHGDYVSVDPATLEYYIRTQGKALFEARATAIAGLRESVCTTSVHIDWLRRHCHRVRKADVPAEWLAVL